MRISENGLNLIKSFEGCRLTAYKCPAGVWTIGWGHTGGVKPGQKITQAEADQMLVSDMTAYEHKVDKYASYHWNQNEFDALTSFAYNVGSIDQLTANGTRNRATIAEKILQYNKGGGKVLPGLTKRREAERKLFLTPVMAKPFVPHWEKNGNIWYYRIGERQNAHGWQKIRNADGKIRWYYFAADGKMCTGWKKIGNEWFYLESTGDFEGACYVTDSKGAQSVMIVKE